MNPDLMTVLSMRQKEMSYHQLALDGRLSPANSNNGFGANSPLQSPLKTPSPHSPESVRQLPLALSLQTAQFEQFGFTWRWIVEVATHFALQRQTAHFANQYAQVLLRRRAAAAQENCVAGYGEDVRHMQRQLRVLGLACVFMAAKIEEVHPPKAAELVAFLAERGATQLAGEDLARLEVDYVVELQWNLHPTTPYAWLLFMVAGGSADQRPLDTMGDFVNPARNPSGTKELFVNAIRLVDIALLDYQAIEYWPSVLAGAALLLVDPALDFMFVAQFYNWTPMCSGSASRGSTPWPTGCAIWRLRARRPRTAGQAAGRGAAVHPVAGRGAQPLGLRPVASDNLVDLYSAGMNTPLGKGYGLEMCPSPCSPSDNYAVVAPPPTCMCKGSYHTCGGEETPGPHVYHFKYGWQGIETGLMAEPNFGNQQEQQMQYP
ncbi:Cyclin-like [Phytophthora cactorum]|nr:Cyclin-like [Phytophthora cactorum]